MPKKKLLPKDFGELLENSSLEQLKQVFETCQINALGGYNKQTALAFNACPDELARWLVDQGADIAAEDKYGLTPLHNRASHWQGRITVLLELGAPVEHGTGGVGTPLHFAAGQYNPRTVQDLLDHGAAARATNENGQTPLSYALSRCSNINIVGMAKIAPILLSVMAAPQKASSRLAAAFGRLRTPKPVVTKEMQNSVERIGKDFEFHRDNFNPDDVDETSAALEELYALFAVSPEPRRILHDGKTAIVATSENWQRQHQELWDLLVPSSGAAATVQGEVIRISGRINDEINRNGGANWNKDYRKMADACIRYLQSGTPLSPDHIAEAKTLLAQASTGGENLSRVCELAAAWVALNPQPVALGKPEYRL